MLFENASEPAYFSLEGEVLLEDFGLRGAELEDLVFERLDVVFLSFAVGAAGSINTRAT